MTAAQPTSGTETLVIVDHLTKSITAGGQTTVILNDITFAVPTHSLFAINGPSGSGKSTLLNMLTGIDRPSSGQVIFDGTAIRARRENALARWRGQHVGIIFQFFQLLPTLTALENVDLALELGQSHRFRGRARRERAQECLRLVGLSDLGHRLPSKLSGGQQQRVAIARALANDPPVIIADEPTGNLDSRTAVEIFDLLAGLTQQGKTVIYVTHDRGLAARASAGIALLDGGIVSRDVTRVLSEVQ